MPLVFLKAETLYNGHGHSGNIQLSTALIFHTPTVNTYQYAFDVLQM